MTLFLDIIQDDRVIKTLIILLVGFLVKALVSRVLHKGIEDIKIYYKTKKIVSYVYFILTIILLLMTWTQTQSIGTYFGLASAGIAIALKDLLINLAAWLFIVVRKPFSVGERIEINGQSGDVIDQRLFQFTLMEIGNWVEADQSTGRMVHIPNGAVFSHPVANFSSGFKYIWNEIHVLLTFESDYKKAKKYFLELAEHQSLQHSKGMDEALKIASKKYMIYYNNLTPIVYTDVKESGINLSIRYLCEPQQRRTSQQAIWEGILDIIQKESQIQLAYPTLRMVKQEG